LLELQEREAAGANRRTAKGGVSEQLPKGYKICPEFYGARFKTPTTFGWCKTAQLARAQIEQEMKTGVPAWKIPFGKVQTAAEGGPFDFEVAIPNGQKRKNLC
jgi:hypothetical protein